MHKRISIVLMLLLTAMLAIPSLAQAGGASRKIVVFDQTIVNDAAKESIIKGAGGVIIKSLRLVNGYAVLLPEQAEKAIASKAGVVRIDDDAIVTATGKTPTATAAQAIPWGISKINAPTAWSKATGNGIKVGVIDTGIDTSHPDLKVLGGVNTINPRKSYRDDNGHGTHVAGIIAALNNTSGVVGVAPAAQLYSIKVLNAAGSGYVSDIIEGLDWSIANGMKVVNMSLGTSQNVPSFHDAVTRAYNAGIVIVAAAGNSGPSTNGASTVNYPAKYTEVIAVSATDSNNGIAGFSSRGPEVDLAAPGVSIYSTYKGASYATLSGTSMAAPHVTGVAALRLTFDPDKSPAHIASVLKNSAVNIGLSTTEQGSGLVDANATVTAP